MLLREIVHQSDSVKVAASLLNSALEEVSDPAEKNAAPLLFFSLEAIVRHAGNLSLLLWSSEATGESTGADLLGLPLSSPLNAPSLKTAQQPWMTLEDRGLDGSNVVEFQIGEASAEAPRPFYLRQYDPVKRTMSYFGQVTDIQALVSEIGRVGQLAEAQLQASR